MLQSLGYRLLVASNGAEAVQAFVANREQIQLLILDVVLLDTLDQLGRVQSNATSPNPALISGFVAAAGKKAESSIAWSSPWQQMLECDLCSTRRRSHQNWGLHCHARGDSGQAENDLIRLTLGAPKKRLEQLLQRKDAHRMMFSSAAPRMPILYTE